VRDELPVWQHHHAEQREADVEIPDPANPQKVVRIASARRRPATSATPKATETKPAAALRLCMPARCGAPHDWRGSAAEVTSKITV